MNTFAIIAGALLATLGSDAPRGVGVEEGSPPLEGTWAAWHGCWRSTSADTPAGEVLCILPGGTPSEVRMVSIADGAVRGTTHVSADGVPRRVEEGGCTGTEAAHWSRDARRLFMRAELECDGMHRVSTGVLAMVADDEWVDVQAATVSGQHATRTIRYVAVPASVAPAEIQAQLDERRALVREAARLRASAPLHVEDVIEAAGMLAEPALQGFLASQTLAFRPDAQSLLRLEAAGVPVAAIDVVVAVSYPQRFVVREAGAIHSVARGTGEARRCYDPVVGVWMYGDDCFYAADRWTYRSRYGYGYYGFGYSPWGYDPYGWTYGRHSVVIVRPGRGDGEGHEPSEVVKGSGYTRGSAPARGTAQPRSNSGSSGSSGTSGSGDARGSDTGRSSPPAREAVPRPPDTSAGSSSGASGSSSSSSGSDSGSSGRTAVPRGGG